MSNSSKFKARLPKLVSPLVIRTNADIVKYSLAGMVGFSFFDKLNQAHPTELYATMADGNLFSAAFVLVAGGYLKKQSKEKETPTENAPKNSQPFLNGPNI